jgi:hypothetical protein
VRALILFGLLFSTRTLAGNPVIGAGDEARQEEEKTPADEVKPVPETKVTDKKLTWGDNEKVGKYGQPRWTTRRHFVGTRVYVAPPGAVSIEAWFEMKVPSGGGDVRVRSLYEFSIGLGARFQADLYIRLQHKGTEPVSLESERVELRWALADWGVIPGNPTLYLEWIRQTEGPQKLEAKLLFGGSLTDRLYWGLNLFFERELWGFEQAHEYGATAGISYSIIERKFALGAELRIEAVDIRDERFQARELEFLVGPSISFQPIDGAHILLVLYGGPGFERGAPTDPFTAQFVFQPTLVGGWRF